MEVTAEEKKFFLQALEILEQRKYLDDGSLPTSTYFGPTLIYETARKLGFKITYSSEQPANRILHSLAREGLVERIHADLGGQHKYLWRHRQNMNI